MYHVYTPMRKSDLVRFAAATEAAYSFAGKYYANPFGNKKIKSFYTCKGTRITFGTYFIGTTVLLYSYNKFRCIACEKLRRTIFATGHVPGKRSSHNITQYVCGGVRPVQGKRKKTENETLAIHIHVYCIRLGPIYIYIYMNTYNNT